MFYALFSSTCCTILKLYLPLHYETSNQTKFSSFNKELDAVLGAQGTPERESNRQLAMQEYISDSLLQARRQSGMSQQQLADRVGTTKAYISKIENGRVNPSASVYLSLMAAVGYTMQLSV